MQADQGKKWNELRARLFKMVSVGVVDDPINQGYDIISTLMLLVNLVGAFANTFDGDRRRLDIIEQKTGKARTFTVNNRIYDFIVGYCYENGIKPDEVIFPITKRSIQRQLKKVVDWLGLEGNISTHSFRKFFATNVYVKNDYDIALVQDLLQHASTDITRRYIGIGTRRVEKALENCTIL